MAPEMIVSVAAIDVTVMIFMLGAAFYAGKLAARVDSLERWRADVVKQFDALHADLRDIKRLIRGEVG